MKFEISLTKDELKLLLSSINYFQIANACINYGEHIEDCENLKEKLFKIIGQPKECENQ